jgi:hypothetical protein
MPLYAILVREYFGARIMGTMFGAIAIAFHPPRAARLNQHA